MEKIATKKFNYDRQSSYKTRGKLGSCTNRNVRVQRASENRHLSRMDEVSKRRRMPLSPLVDENTADSSKSTFATNNTNAENQKTDVPRPELNRREKLLKWREERRQKKQSEPQKKSFTVGHVKYSNDTSLFAAKIKNSENKVISLSKPAQFATTKSAKPLTRSSARLAKQVSPYMINEQKSRPIEKVKPKATSSVKGEVKPEKTSVITRQSSRSRAPSVSKTNQVGPEVKSQVKTRSQAKNAKPPAAKETCLSKPGKSERQEKSMTQSTKISPIKQPPELNAIKTTVSFGRGSTEGVDRVHPKTNENPSFAPADFQFTAPVGVNTFTYMSKTFTFQPLSPSSADEFMFPSSVSSLFSFSPKKATEKPVESVMLQDPVAAYNMSSATSSSEEQNNGYFEDKMSSTACVPMETSAQEGMGLKNATIGADTSIGNPPNEQQSIEITDTKSSSAPCDVLMQSFDKADKHQTTAEHANSLIVTPGIEHDQQNKENADVKPASKLCDVPIDTSKGTENSKSTDNLANTELETTEKQSSVEINSVDASAKENDDSQKHDARYFRNLVKTETERLNETCKKWDTIKTEEQSLSEEVTGQIRTTIGQAQLLIDQRFRQFSGLIDLSEDKNAEKQATASDLQGFWEMIYYQVEDVNAKFDALEKLKENNWQQEEKKTRKIIRKTKPKKAAIEPSAKPCGRPPSTRNRIQEMRMAMKAKMAAEKEKLTAEKRHQEGEAFVTILTPVKKSKKDDDNGEVVLTPVRRSTRRTPMKASTIKSTPVVVTTPKITTEDSPGLRLTPNNANVANEVTAPVEAMDTEETQKDAVLGESCEGVGETGMEPKNEGNKMDIDPLLILKSACKSAKRESRMLSVTFQSPTENEHQQQTAESTDLEEATEPVSSNPIETEARRRKKGTPQRFSSRKCRRRVSTPYHHDRPGRRHAVGDNEPSESESQSSGDSDSSGANAEAQGSVSGLRRSLRRTPSKYRDSTPLETERELNGKNPAVKLFHLSEESTENETPRIDSELETFVKYLRSSSSDDDDNAKETMEPGGMTPGKKAIQSSVTPSLQLAALNLSSPGNDEKRRDSVFFAPTSSFNESQVAGNLMCFSPLVERDNEEEGQE
ncbi:PREDICTED: uncharacterized protein LOC107345681 isoform X3 [Acropora digitifera]|uniref:uncharacterized protein LOC107345681 isoform X3 n=1 Tax=Acropora digitifera TaxID=70779 RepID=UPI00077AFE10|nr:PREDICTED: uncharacterized protein LOC107345681 isoform X3 [Acropora digitifera]